MIFIDNHKGCFGIESICATLSEHGIKIAPSTYYAVKKRGAAHRTLRDAHVVDVLRSTKDTPESLYGYKKMWHHLRREGYSLPRCTVARLMRQEGMKGVTRCAKVRTTIQAKDGKRAGDLLNRDFHADAPNRCWVADFTYVSTWSGMVYVAFVFEVFSQLIVGWNIARRKETDLVLSGLKMALWRRDHTGHPVSSDLIHHSDAGSQYTSIRFTEHLVLQGIKPSIGSVGDAYDNALAETLIGLYKRECIHSGLFHTGSFKTLDDVEYATMQYINWYNNHRLHSTLGMIPPAEYETNHYTTNSHSTELATT